MTWDDHDLMDGWGSYPSTVQQSPVFQGLYIIMRRWVGEPVEWVGEWVCEFCNGLVCLCLCMTGIGVWSIASIPTV
jgi:hypothetical protein